MERHIFENLTKKMNEKRTAHILRENNGIEEEDGWSAVPVSLGFWVLGGISEEDSLIATTTTAFTTIPTIIALMIED